jgi:hypothetical protein
VIALLITLVLFPIVVSRQRRCCNPLPPAIAARIAFVFLLGVGARRCLFALAALGVPMNVWTFLAIPVLSLFGVRRQRLRFLTTDTKAEAWPPHSKSSARVLFIIAAVMPTRDYDGRDVAASARDRLEGSTTGPFFHGQRGLNLHNRYPLLLPLDAATVMQLSNDTNNRPRAGCTC